VKRSNDNSNKIEKDNNHRPQMLIYSTENQEQSMDDSITHIKTVHSRQTLKGDTTSSSSSFWISVEFKCSQLLWYQFEHLLHSTAKS
jgi:hypothetical protein